MADRAMALEGDAPYPLPGSQKAASAAPVPRSVAPVPAAKPKGKVAVLAVSKDRHRASASERRMYGGAAVTDFYVYRRETKNDPSKWKVVRGYGRTPGERKTFAIERSGLL